MKVLKGEWGRQLLIAGGAVLLMFAYAYFDGVEPGQGGISIGLALAAGVGASVGALAHKMFFGGTKA
jgi:hypothetical protein